jgi:ATP-dependent DNA helicase RecG
MTLESPITDIKGVGDAVAKKYAVLGIKTISDLIDYFPRRYEDYSQITPVSQLQPGVVTIEAVIKQSVGRYVRRGMHITEAVASDETGSVKLIWFNQPYRAAALKPGQTYFIAGQYELRRQRFTIMNPAVEAASEFPINTARIIGVYRETKGLTSKQIRQAIKSVLPIVRATKETMPEDIVAENGLLSRAKAIEAIHFPKDGDELEAAKKRLGFEEVFHLSLASLLNKQENQTEHSLAIPFKEQLAKEFVGHLPFQLTDDQRRAIWQIYLDLQREQPMNRLVEGDVGSGKTVVAAMAAVMAIAQGYQVAFMAPTELLARQHADTLWKLLKPLGWEDSLQLLVGSFTAAQKKSAHKAIAEGKARFIVGTHALIQEGVDMHQLALVIIDEQHRFGVEQRKALMAKAGHMPHVLSLTATPIPRSLALTLFGELDITVLAEKPAGRLPIITQIVSPNSRAQLYEAINTQLEHGHQMYVVCPLITESEVLDVNSAEEVYKRFKTKDFKNRRIGLLHGKLKPAEKQSVMEQFLARQLDILVATTVIEVGVDVSNSNIMLIESAERFGLAQLHQLRGRVGRGTAQAYCYLMLSDSQPPSRRLRAMESSNDGFRLAELDLELRGPGAIYGIHQHGLLDLHIAKLTDVQLIANARKTAQGLLDTHQDLLKYKQLMKHVNRLRAVTNLN